MAPTYPQYNNYYDPVGSQANQPQGYAYHNPGTSVSQPPSVTYSAQSYPSYGHNTYNTAQQGSNTSGQHHVGNSGVGTSSAVGGTGAITGTGQNNQATASRSSSTQQYDNGWGNPNHATSSYSGNLQAPGRSQSNKPPVYASSGSAANFGRSTNATNQPTQSSMSTYGQQTGSQNYPSTGSADTSRMSFGASQHGVAAGEPSRYASPLHAVQAQQQQSRQQGHTRQSSQTSTYQATPATNSRGSDQRQESATMAAAANTTVDPSQVYDLRAERERKAKIEAEKRRKQDEANAARKAEEARVAEAKRLAEEQNANEAKRRMEEAQRQIGEARAAAKAEADRKKEEQRKARESKNAATALASLASSSSVPQLNEAQPPANDEEAEMRAMFQKMREFNSKNPAMLAKLWEEERRAHAGQSQSPQPAQVTQAAASTPKPTATSKASSSQASAANAKAPSSGKTTPAQNAKTSKASPNMSVARSKAPETSNNQGSTNLWPPGKKGLLADIAARWLHGVNPQKVVTAFEILQLLDQNPNYVQLCESLEGLGLKFERAAFARELLRGVPPAGNANQHAAKGSDATIMSANGTLAQAAGASGTEHRPNLQASSTAGLQQRRPSSLMGWNTQPNGKAASSNNGMVDYEMPSFHHSSAANQTAGGTSDFPQPGRAGSQSAIGHSHSRQPSQSVQPSRRSVSNVQQGAPVPVGSARQTPDVKPLSPPRPPANKEEAARKRGFGELVDLTAEESDEEAPPKKMMQTAQGFGPRPFQPQPPQSHPHLNQQRDSPFAFNTRGAPAIPTGPSPGSKAPPFNLPSVPGIPAVANMGSMGSTATGSPAMTPSTANMRATDVSGPVSAKPPLPSSTTLPYKRKGPTNEQLQAERIRGKMVVEPIMRDRVARRTTYDSRTIARDVLLATGRHPDMRALNSHLNVMQKLLGDRGGMADGSGNKSDLATIKWDIIDPDPPKKNEPSSRAQTQDVAAFGDADGEEDVSSLNDKPRTGGAATARQSSAALDLRDKPATPDAMPKKRGRPPRSSMPNTHTFVSVNDQMSAAGQQITGAAGTPRQGSGQPRNPAASPAARAPSASQAPTDGSVGYSAFRHFDENGNPIKKKGRPVGWRKNIHSREAQGLAPAKSASAGVKPKASVPKQPEKLQEPNYQIYRCKWLDCAAELHSLDVLKKHMIKVHGRPNGEDLFECLWQDCQSKTKRVSGSGKTRLDNATFSDIGEWLTHVDKEHLQPVAWRLGDGPRGGLSDQAESEASEAYLSDSRGRSVTPIIQPMANFGLGMTPGQAMPARIGRPPAGASKDERGAQAELQKLKERKIAVGPTMEKMGVRLANDKRRMGFLDDENFEDIVESESE